MTAAPSPTVWNNRHFLSLWSGLLVSNLGDWISYVAMFAVVYQQTHSALAVVGLRLVHIVPELLFAPFAGVFVDRWNRKRTMVVAPLAVSLIVGSLVFAHPTAVIFVAEFAITLGDMFFEPAFLAALPNIVSEEQLTSANTLSRITSTAATLAGPLIGGLLIAGVGASAAFGVDAVSFLVIAILVTTIRVPQGVRPPSVATIERELLEGIRYLRAEPMVATVVTAGAIFILVPSTIFTVGIVFSDSVLRAGSAGYGVLLAAGGAGSLVAALTLISGRLRVPEQLSFAVSGILQGAAFVLMGFSHVLLPAALLYGAADSMATVNTVSSVTLIQRLVPDALRGRVFGASSSLTHFAAAVSALFVAATVGLLGAGGVISVAGVAAVLGGFWTLFMLRRQQRA